jgi:Flp pilus assembly protein TadD
MRPALLLSLLLLVSCTSTHDTSFSSRPPGLDVADVALANGAPDTALRIAQQALAANPHNVAALIRAAGAQAALGQRDLAARSLGQALAIAPDNDEAALGLGRLKLATDPAEAAEVFLRVTTRYPHNVAALVDLGIASDLLGQHDEAQRNYRRALAIEPDRLAANVNLGLSLALSGDAQQALRILRPLALGPGTSPRIRQDLAVALALAGDNAEAVSILHKDMSQPDILATVAGYHLLQAGPTMLHGSMGGPQQPQLN